MVETRSKNRNDTSSTRVKNQQKKKLALKSRLIKVRPAPETLKRRRSARVISHENNSNDSALFDKSSGAEDETTRDECSDDEEFGRKDLRCDKCNRKFGRKHHLDRHIRFRACLTAEEKKVYKCDYCMCYYSRPDNLQQHMRLHELETASTSSTENQMIPSQGLTENQPVDHKRTKNHVCKHCNKSFYAASLLKLHERKHTGEKPHPCDECDKQFTTSSALKKHARTHTGDRPYKCDSCDRQFATRGTLNRHVRVHAGIRPYVCEYCGKGFGQSGGLKAHLFFHTGENGFECEHCKRKFNRKERLKTHIMYVHQQEKPFDCEQCDKKFVRKEDLARHALIHAGTRPHSCNICHARFTLKFSVNLHLLTHQSTDPHFCSECNAKFKRKDGLIRHQRKWHRDAQSLATTPEPRSIDTDSNSTNSNDRQPGIEEVEDEPLAELIHLFDFDQQTREIKNNKLADAVIAFLCKLVDEPTRKSIGWPDIEAQGMLNAVIRLCGQEPIGLNDPSFSSDELLRQNVKLLFKEVEDPTISSFLGIKTVDEIVLYLIQMLD